MCDENPSCNVSKCNKCIFPVSKTSGFPRWERSSSANRLQFEYFRRNFVQVCELSGDVLG